MLPKIRYLTAMLATVSVLSVAAQTAVHTTSQTTVQSAAQAELSIQLFDRQVYVPGSPVYVKVTVRNETTLPWRFKLADEKRLSVAFDIRTIANRTVAASDAYKRAIASSLPVFYRELSVEPGEEYSFVQDLRDFADLSQPGSYVVSCSLYPELAGRGTKPPVTSNTLSLAIRPGAMTPAVAELYKEDTATILRAESIGPDEVVSRTIEARQKSRWNEFFLYLDVERLLEANPDKKRSYVRESDDGRRRMLEAYRTDLMANIVDSDIVVIPSSFSVMETRYGPTYGTVVVRQKFDYDGFRMVKDYTYELERRNDVWYIVGYTVINKGTE